MFDDDKVVNLQVKRDIKQICNHSSNCTSILEEWSKDPSVMTLGEHNLTFKIYLQAISDNSSTLSRFWGAMLDYHLDATVDSCVATVVSILNPDTTNLIISVTSVVTKPTVFERSDNAESLNDAVRRYIEHNGDKAYGPFIIMMKAIAYVRDDCKFKILEDTNDKLRVLVWRDDYDTAAELEVNLTASDVDNKYITDSELI